MKKLFFSCLVLLLIVGGCGQAGDQQTGKSESGQETVAREYNLEHYVQIKLGHTYEEVQAILGDPGENMVDNDRLKQYQWENEDKSIISVTLYDNEVTGKSQAYLGPLLTGKKSVTLNMYNKLKEGMTLQEVIDVLGPGTERMLVSAEGQETVIMGWDNNDGSGISVTLLEGEVVKTSSMMLK